VLFAVVLVLLSPGGVFADDGEPAEQVDVAPAPPDPGATVLKIRTIVPRRSPWGEVLIGLSRRLEAEGKDAAGKPRLAVRVEWQVTSEAKAVKACEAGKVGGVAVSFAALTASAPELAATALPFLFDGYDQADRALKGARSLIAEILAARGFVLALRIESGFRHWASRRSFLLTPDTFKGKALRSQPSNVSLATYRALGAVPQTIDGAQVNEKLSSGDIDGYDESLVFGRLAQWSKDITFVTLSRHSYEAAGLVWCKSWLESQPSELQASLTRRDAKTEALELSGLMLIRRFNDDLMPRQYLRAGKQLRELTKDERGAFKAALGDVERQFSESTSPKGRELLERLRRR